MATVPPFAASELPAKEAGELRFSDKRIRVPAVEERGELKTVEFVEGYDVGIVERVDTRGVSGERLPPQIHVGAFEIHRPQSNKWISVPLLNCFHSIR